MRIKNARGDPAAAYDVCCRGSDNAIAHRCSRKRPGRGASRQTGCKYNAGHCAKAHRPGRPFTQLFKLGMLPGARMPSASAMVDKQAKKARRRLRAKLISIRNEKARGKEICKGHPAELIVAPPPWWIVARAPLPRCGGRGPPRGTRRSAGRGATYFTLQRQHLVDAGDHVNPAVRSEDSIHLTIHMRDDHLPAYAHVLSITFRRKSGKGRHHLSAPTHWPSGSDAKREVQRYWSALCSEGRWRARRGMRFAASMATTQTAVHSE